MEALKTLQIWLENLSVVGIIYLCLFMVIVLLPELVVLSSYFSKARWPWIRTLIENKDNQPDHADGNFIMTLYISLNLFRLASGSVVIMWFTERDFELLILELLGIACFCIGIKYVPMFYKRGTTAISERIEEKISTTITKKQDGKSQETEKTEGA